MSLCLSAAGVTVALALTQFTLSWTHSVEKTEWRETWRVGEERLVLESAAVKGSGAGIDPPPDSRLQNGFWRWHPDTRHERVVLNDAGSGRPWRFCSEGLCVPARKIVPSRGSTLAMKACSEEGVPLAAFTSKKTGERSADE